MRQVPIIGIDEVGRGPWAGPLVAAAVMLPPTSKITGLTDSKKLNKAQRESIFKQIREHAVAIGIGWVPSQTIDEVGLTQATRLAMERSIDQIESYLKADHEIIIDGNYNYLSSIATARAVIKADLSVPAVSAASIVAKVCRDHYMRHIHSQFPDYNFEHHVGYGTAKHREALVLLGPCRLHRLSFLPVKSVSSK